MRSYRRVALYMDIQSSYDHGIARGVIRFAKERGTWRLFGHGFTLAEIKDLRRWSGDGIISRIRTAEQAQALVAIHLPIVDVAGAVRHPRIFHVTNDDYQTGCLGGSHLRAAGFRHFAFAGVPGDPWARDRYEGFCSALSRPPAEVPVFEQTLAWWEKPGIPAALKKWLAGLFTPVGIMACNDTVGVKLTSACHALGLSVPQHVAVLGVDNEDVLCELSNPSLTSIPCDTDRVGYEAARALDEIIEGRSRGAAERVRVPPLPLVARASTDTVAIEDERVAQALRFIRGNSDLSINVSDVLRVIPMCRRALEIRFRKAVGCTIHDEIRRTRIEHACRLLASTDLPVAKVAIASGFSSHQRFHTVFREQMKMLPLAYREQRTRAAGRPVSSLHAR
ncbi:MAG TPA: XylR family transcriptional regulator [Planctomycetota bacterium]|nr:XylR family transcriptional regulator [Planctomycetota bacterium]